MGLDNMPLEYPCAKQGTAVMTTLKSTPGNTEPRISCAETQDAGGCPWKEAAGRPADGQVLGMFGTDCWYRGKHGNALIQEYGTYDELDHLSFYGDLNDGQVKSAGSCVELADHIDTLIEDDEEFAQIPKQHQLGLRYATWYLRWVADSSGGLNCWY